MIQLTCTNCKTVLDIDDGFAGGACRCQHCGTVQTVPLKQQRSNRPATPGGAAAPAAAANGATAVSGARTLLAGTTPAAAERGGGGESLNDLATYVHSSGLSGSGLRSSALHKPAAGTGLKDNKKLLIIGGAVAGVLLLVILLVVILRSGDKGQPGGGGGSGGSGGSSSVSGGGNTATAVPNYMGVSLKGPTVIYLLDHGQGSQPTFSSILGATLKSLGSLKPGTRFQVIFWETEKLDFYPPDGMKDATPENIEECKKLMREMVAFGSSKITTAMAKAMAQKPAEIVIVTGKGALDDDFVKSVLDIHKGAATKIHAVSVGQYGSPEVLRKIAEKTGGTFREVTGQPLRDFADLAP